MTIEKAIPITAKMLREKNDQLTKRLLDELDKFIEENPQIPAQILMAGLGTLFIEFSLNQTSEEHTLLLIEELKGAVLRIRGPISTPH